MKNPKPDPRGFKAISVGRAVELVREILAGSDEPGLADALLELLAGVCDELGESSRFTAALSAMRHVHAMRSDDWLSQVSHLQNSAGTIETVLQ